MKKKTAQKVNPLKENKLLVILPAAIIVLILAWILTSSLSGKNTSFRRALADVNRDGIINIPDGGYIESILGTLNPKGKLALADINQDNQITTADIDLFKQFKDNGVSSCESADIFTNGIVNQKDIDFVSQNQNQIVNSSNMPADLNGDGLINAADLTLITNLNGCKWDIPRGNK